MFSLKITALIIQQSTEYTTKLEQHRAISPKPNPITDKYSLEKLPL